MISDEVDTVDRGGGGGWKKILDLCFWLFQRLGLGNTCTVSKKTKQYFGMFQKSVWIFTTGKSAMGMFAIVGGAMAHLMHPRIVIIIGCLLHW